MAKSAATTMTMPATTTPRQLKTTMRLNSFWKKVDIWATYGGESKMWAGRAAMAVRLTPGSGVWGWIGASVPLWLGATA